jgi:hypothetical protein
MTFKCSNGPHRVPDSQSLCPSCNTSFDIWPRFGAATTGFATIYADVTGRLRAMAQSKSTDAQNTAWLLYLIQSFHNQYLAWQWKPGLRAYLEGFHRRRVPRLFALSGDVYLHISYDLPRVIADSLKLAGKDDFALGVTQPTNLFDARALYLNGGPEFYNVLDDHAASFSVSGFFAFPAAVARKLSALRVLGHWVIALRSVAWIHAENLVDSANRAILEDRLFEEIASAASATLNSPWNPARWSIPAPVLAIATVAVLGGCAAPTDTGTGVLAVVAGLVAYAALIYGLTIRAIDSLGNDIFKRVSTVFLAESKEHPTRQPPAIGLTPM